MYRTLITIFCIIFIVVTNAAWLKLPTSIGEDAAKLTRLTEEFWSLKPAIFKNNGPLVLCQFINECCAVEDRFQAISSMVFSIANEYRNKNRYGRIINKCINSTDLEEASQYCPLLHNLMFPLTTAQVKSAIKQYMDVIMDYFTELDNLIKHVYESCNNEEIHALLCLSNTTLVKTCVTKILQEMYDNNGYKSYHEFILKTKETLIDLNQQLFPFIVKNTNTD